MNKAEIKKYSEKFNAIGERERLLILFGIVAILLFVWIYFLFLPLHQQLKLASAPVSAAKNSLEVVRANYQNLIAMDKNPPFAALNQQQKLLLQKFEEIKSNPAYSKKAILPFDKMRGLLQTILSTEPELTLDHLEELPNSQLVIEFNGDYFSTMSFFQKLESQPWFFFYDEFDYKVNDYPDAQIKLVVHTLDLKEPTS